MWGGGGHQRISDKYPLFSAAGKSPSVSTPIKRIQNRETRGVQARYVELFGGAPTTPDPNTSAKV